MGFRKQNLHESIQLLEARIANQSVIINGLTSENVLKNKINPSILNSAKYNVVLSTADKIQAISRYVTDIPELNIPSNRLECLWYDYGSLAFYRDTNNCLKVSTYAKTGGLNSLGDLTSVYPIDFSGKTYPIKKTVVYSNALTTNPVVIINDYSGTYREETITPRRSINNVSIDDQTLVYKQLKNSIKLTAKKAIAILESPTQREAVENVVNDILDNDNPVMSIVAKNISEVFKLHNIDTKLDIEGYIRAIENYERIRANFNGIKTRSHLEKKANMIKDELENDNILTEIYLYDGLINRQIGIELMKKHSIITNGSCKLNPLFEKKKEQTNDNESV